jgi:hypothetical protein
MSDNRRFPSYAQFMEWAGPFIRVKLDTSDPIELREFVGAFTSVGSEYDRYIRAEKPDADPNATLFVREVRAGCIKADLMPWLATAAGTAMIVMENANTIGAFVERYGALLGLYLPKGGKAPDASVTQLKDFSDQVAAIASTPNSRIEVAAIEIKDGGETYYGKVGLYAKGDEAEPSATKITKARLAAWAEDDDFAEKYAALTEELSKISARLMEWHRRAIIPSQGKVPIPPSPPAASPPESGPPSDGGKKRRQQRPSEG